MKNLFFVIAAFVAISFTSCDDVAGKVWVGYYDATFLTDRYDINDKDAVVDMVNASLDNLSNTVINQ